MPNKCLHHHDVHYQKKIKKIKVFIQASTYADLNFKKKYTKNMKKENNYVL